MVTAEMQGKAPQTINNLLQKCRIILTNKIEWLKIERSSRIIAAILSI